jgi:hypothetical protein
MEAGSGLVLLSVRFRVPDWPRFADAFSWLLEQIGVVEGCSFIKLYRSFDPPDEALVVELWDAESSRAVAYGSFGEVPMQFVERAGFPEMLSERYWSPGVS